MTRGGDNTAGAGDLQGITQTLGFSPERTRGVRVNKATLDKTATRLYSWDTAVR